MVNVQTHLVNADATLAGRESFVMSQRTNVTTGKSVHLVNIVVMCTVKNVSNLITAYKGRVRTLPTQNVLNVKTAITCQRAM